MLKLWDPDHKIKVNSVDIKKYYQRNIQLLWQNTEISAWIRSWQSDRYYHVPYCKGKEGLTLRVAQNCIALHNHQLPDLHFRLLFEHIQRSYLKFNLYVMIIVNELCNYSYILNAFHFCSQPNFSLSLKFNLTFAIFV